MAGKIKIRAKAKKGVAQIKALITHPMNSGMAKDKKTGKTIPADFITDLTVSVNGKEVAAGMLSGAISKNPYIAVSVEAAKGDKIAIAYTDKAGNTGSGEGAVK